MKKKKSLCSNLILQSKINYIRSIFFPLLFFSNQKKKNDSTYLSGISMNINNSWVPVLHHTPPPSLTINRISIPFNLHHVRYSLHSFRCINTKTQWYYRNINPRRPLPLQNFTFNWTQSLLIAKTYLFLEPNRWGWWGRRWWWWL